MAVGRPLEMSHDKIRFFRYLGLTRAQSVFIFDEHLHSGGVVKLVITSACHAEGRGFESRLSRHFFHTNSDSHPFMVEHSTAKPLRTRI
jgi:hypothetical protein